MEGKFSLRHSVIALPVEVKKCLLMLKMCPEGNLSLLANK
jgi:hypothetical protein